MEVHWKIQSLRGRVKKKQKTRDRRRGGCFWRGLIPWCTLCLIHYDLGTTYYKITVHEKIQTSGNKIVQNKAEDRQTDKILV